MSETLFSVQTPKGTTLHLVREGEQYTLCGRHHGINPRYISSHFSFVHNASQATCTRCLRLAETPL